MWPLPIGSDGIDRLASIAITENEPELATIVAQTKRHYEIEPVYFRPAGTCEMPRRGGAAGIVKLRRVRRSRLNRTENASETRMRGYQRRHRVDLFFIHTRVRERRDIRSADGEDVR